MIRTDTLRELTAQVQSDSEERRAKEIEIANHLYQVKHGQSYRCQFCLRESPAVLWKDMYTCPICGREYNPLLAQDEEE